MNVDQNEDLEMTDQDFDDRVARGEEATVLAGGVAGGDHGSNRYFATNVEPRIARSDNKMTQAASTR